MKIYKDEIHGLITTANTVTGAYAVIRRKCLEKGLIVPKKSQIKEVKV